MEKRRASLQLQQQGCRDGEYCYLHINIIFEFKPKQSHANADGLSRLPVPDNAAVRNPQDVTLFNVSQIVSLPVTEVHIQAATRKDPVVGAVLRYTQQGWPSQTLNKVGHPKHSTRLAIPSSRTLETILAEKK